MKKIKYIVLCTVLLGLIAEVSSAAMVKALQEVKVASRRLVRPFARLMSTAAVERELASIGKSKNPTGEMDIPVKAAIHVDWEEQVAMGHMFGEDPSSRVVSVKRIPGVGVFGRLTPDTESKKNNKNQ